MPPASLRVESRVNGVRNRVRWLIALAFSATLGGTAATRPGFTPPQLVQMELQTEESRDVADDFEQPVATSREPEPQDFLSTLDDPAPPDPFPRKISLPPNALAGGI